MATVCQLIDRSISRFGEPVSVKELIADTGLCPEDLLPVLNKMLGVGLLTLRDKRITRPQWTEGL